ncbi:hypothetical protein R3P38DRAFT_2694046, partial [Favolaschia claudopus]
MPHSMRDSGAMPANYLDPASPFTAQLGTNYVPGDGEILDIRRLVQSDSIWARELVRMDEQIQEIEISLRHLREKRDALKGNIDAHKALVSPMRLAPDDILREIFIACLPSATNALMDPKEAPLLFGRICRHWRDIALSTPMLWASIHVPLTPRAGMDISVTIGVLQRWLKLSGGCPLAISLYSQDVYDSSLYDPHHIVSMVLDVSSRLRRLSLRGPFDIFLPLLSLGPDSLPCLRRLELSDSSHPDTQLFKDHPEAMNIIQLPSLTGLSMLSAGMDCDLLSLRWSQLTSLTLFQHNYTSPEEPASGHLDCNKALEILRRCPNLRRCSLTITELDLNHCALSSNPVHISLPFLESLTLAGDFLLSSWISKLSLPELSYLCIGDMRNDGFRYGTITSPNIVVRINSGFLTSSALFDILNSFSLTHLELTCDNYFDDAELSDTRIIVDDAFLERLCPPHNMCPLLTHLIVSNPSSDFSGSAAMDFVRARMGMDIRLQCFEVHYSGEAVDTNIPDIQSFVADGLRLKFKNLSRNKSWGFNP